MEDHRGADRAVGQEGIGVERLFLGFDRVIASRPLPLDTVEGEGLLEGDQPFGDAVCQSF